MLLKEGKVVCKGSFSEICSTGFNIKDILDSYNQSLQDKGEVKKEFTNEVSKSPAKKKEEKTPLAATVPTADKQQNLVVSEEKLDGNIGLKDYSNMMSFSIGNIALVLYLAISVATSLI